MIDLQNLFPISKLVVCSSFFVVFLHEVFVVIFYLKSFVAFLTYICALFLFFSAVFNFWINLFFTIIFCLKLIGRNKWTKSLIVSNYPLVQILNWKLPLWDVLRNRCSHIQNAPIINSSILGVTIGSIFIYFSLSINELLSLRLNFMKTFIKNLILDNIWVMDDYNLFFSIKSVWNNNLSFLNFRCCNKLKSQQIINCLILSYKFTLLYLYHACNL